MFGYFLQSLLGKEKGTMKEVKTNLNKLAKTLVVFLWIFVFGASFYHCLDKNESASLFIEAQAN